MNRFRLASFNCRSVKSSLDEVRDLCDKNDIVCLQEHWLLPNELNVLSAIHPEFLATGLSAVDISKDLLVGRPYGGTAILYRQSLHKSINVVTTNDCRITGILIDSHLGPVLLLCVYMPTNNGDEDCLESYIDTCSRIGAIFTDCEAVNFIVIGDFNCQPGSRFYTHFTQLAADNKLIFTDISRLNDDVFTYCSDSGLNTSWTDHILCSTMVDNTVSSVNILYDFISSDHKPIEVSFDQLLLCSDVKPDKGSYGTIQTTPDWNSADKEQLYKYEYMLSSALCNVNIPAELFSEQTCTGIESSTTLCRVIDDYYNAVIQCIHYATDAAIPARKYKDGVYNTPGWNDVVADKHVIARDAFLDWVFLGKPRQGASFIYMKKTRASFKLALRYCRQHEEYLRADACAQDLCDKDYRQFWNSVSKMSNNKATKHAISVGGASGQSEVANMWRTHFDNLYNSVADGGAKDVFFW